MDRREFLRMGLASLGSTSLLAPRLWGFEPVNVSNPLGVYPDRDWEKVYRDQYRTDGWFNYVCAPNDTHNCFMRAFLRNGVVIRTEQEQEGGRRQDLYGNSDTVNWNPRGCLKGMTFQRRLYGPYRLQQPLIRKGWKQWADDGFPSLSDDPQLRDKYKFNSRGTDTFERVKWDDMYRYHAKAVMAIARTYSGAEGEKRLAKDGYEPEMIEACHHAGTRTMKLRGGMGLVGVMGKYGLYRWANMLALLDERIRKVPPKEALGGRGWSNYTWHGDQAPGHPFVHGLQTSDGDFNDMRHAKLHISCGKNLVENKMADNHFFIEMMERGGKIVVITPEYSPASTKADYWIQIKPGCRDTALFLGITRKMIEEKWYKEDFVKAFTDFPLLIRTDSLQRLRAADVIANYKPGLAKDGPSYRVQHLTDEQYARVGDFCIYDEKQKAVRAITRDQMGEKLAQDGLSPALSYTGKIKLANGNEVEVMTLWDAYQIHLRDYDLDTVSQITGADKALVERLAKDIWDTTQAGHSVAIHVGEGINHWFHATLANRSQFLPLMLTGQVGKPGAGCLTWAGNYKAALFQGSPETGPGFAGWVAEDPFQPNLDEKAEGKATRVNKVFKDEEPAYWNHGDRPLVVNTPKYGRRCFTGETHMPTPTKFLWFNNVNHFNNAKHAYDSMFVVNPKIDCIIAQDIEMTSTCEYSDLVYPANTWMEFQTYEITGSCSNPFLGIWKGGIKPIHDTRDDLVIAAEAAEALAKEANDTRMSDYWRFVLQDKVNGVKVYMQRMLDSSTTTQGYKIDDIMAGKYGAPGVALMLFRTYPRIPLYENVHDSLPFWTDTGRMNAYCDIPEAITHGENFIVHREGPEATPYLPNVIVSSNPLIRPDDFGIPREAMHWDERTVRNVKLPWAEVQKTTNPLWEQGYNFYLLTPKTRHRVHSSWSNVDWHMIWDSSFGDPYRRDRRLAFFGEHQLHINPEDARMLKLNNGDYVYVDSNPADRPYRGWQKDLESPDPNARHRAKTARLMLRVTFNTSYPRGVVMCKHAPFIATEKTVKAHEDPKGDGRCRSADTNYQANLRYGAQQSCTRDWLMPMHQTDTLFHKNKIRMVFMFGGEADNHAVNTVPKETLVKITKAEDGGLDGKGQWDAALEPLAPNNTDSPQAKQYLSGGYIKIAGRS